MIFAGRVIETYDFTHPREEITHRLQELTNTDRVVPKKSHQTALWDSILSSAALFGPPRVGDGIYPITDGGDNQSHASVGQVQRTLLSQRIRMFAFVLERRNFAMEEEQAGVEAVSHLAVETGGYAASMDQRAADAQTRMQSAIVGLYDKIVYFYRIDLSGPAGKKSVPLKVK